MMYEFEHFGVPVKEKQPGMIYVPQLKVWFSDYQHDPCRIEWIYFEKDAPFHPLILSMPHVCFIVPDLQQAVRGKTILFPPTVYRGETFAFVNEQGAVIELVMASSSSQK